MVKGVQSHGILYLIRKLDGIRFGMIGSCAALAHARMFSTYSSTVLPILTHAGLRHSCLLNTAHLKAFVAAFDQYATTHGLLIALVKFDVKEFFTNILHRALLDRVKFVFDKYAHANKTDRISVPKYPKTDTTLKPLPGHPPREVAHRYFTFKLSDIYAVIKFALITSVFQLGTVFLVQIVGLPMGNHFSPPLSLIYLAYDEHHMAPRIARCISRFGPGAKLDMTRYADDGTILLAAKTRDQLHRIFNFVIIFMQACLYEHDIAIADRQLNIVPVLDTRKFLDADIVLYDGDRRIKIIYHNSNADSPTTNTQSIGRFFHPLSPSPRSTLLAGPTAIFIRIADMTTFPLDTLLPIFQVIHECNIIAHQPISMILSTIHKAARARPNPIWDIVIVALHILKNKQRLKLTL